MKMKNKKNENENEQSCENLCNLVVRKRKMIKDERGQWIISAGFLVSVSIIILALLLNQAMMGGYQSSGAILEFPKHGIRELVQETHREVNIAAERAWNMSGRPIVTGTAADDPIRDDIILNFTSIMSNYSSSVEYLYASHGQMVYMNISSVNFSTSNGTANKMLSANVTILFSDGVTTCTFEPEIIEIPGVSEHIETLYAEDLTSGDCYITNASNATGASDNVSATVLNVSNNGTVNATIGNHSVGSGPISSVNFEIRLKNGTGWVNDTINISYSPDNGNTWDLVNTSQPNVSSLTWYGTYTAANVTTWGKVDNMTIRITGRQNGTADNGNLSIDAYHVYVKYYQ